MIRFAENQATDRDELPTATEAPSSASTPTPFDDADALEDLADEICTLPGRR